MSTTEELMTLFAHAIAEQEIEQARQAGSSEEEIQKRFSCSRKHKIIMNRIQRERRHSKNLPYPEVDNWYERLRSRVVVKYRAAKVQKTGKKSANA